MNFKISIIVPVYNSKKYIKECLDSIINQTYRNFEVIVIDDGSTDNSSLIIEDYANKNENIQCIHKKNEGVSVARNMGIDIAKGEYIVFVDSDDCISKYYIECLVYLIKNSDMGIIKCTADFKQLEKSIINKNYRNLSSIYYLNNIFEGKRYNTYTWNRIFRTSIIKSNHLYFRSDINLWEDMLFIIQYLNHSKEIVINDSKLYFYRQHSDSAVHNITAQKIYSKILVLSELNKKTYNINYDFNPLLQKNIIDYLFRKYDVCVFNEYKALIAYKYKDTSIKYLIKKSIVYFKHYIFRDKNRW